MVNLQPNCYQCKNLYEKANYMTSCGQVIEFGCHVIENITMGNPATVICSGFSKKMEVN